MCPSNIQAYTLVYNNSNIAAGVLINRSFLSKPIEKYFRRQIWFSLDFSCTLVQDSEIKRNMTIHYSCEIYASVM